LSLEAPKERLMQAGRKTRDALRHLRNLVRAERKKKPSDPLFAQMDEAVELATDGLIELSDASTQLLRDSVAISLGTSGNVDAQAILQTLTSERNELREDLQKTRDQLERFAHDLQELYRREREKAQALRVALERLQEVDRLKSAFLAQITDKLLSQLVPMDMALQVLKRQDLTESQQGIVLEFEEPFNIHRKMITGLVKYAQLGNKTRVPTPRPLDVAKVVEEALAPLRIQAEMRGRQFHVNLPQPVPSLVADEDMVKDALYQLTDNALKFTPKDGKIEVRVLAKDEGVLFEVEDTGEGIPPEVMAHLGKPFPVVNPEQIMSQGGLGLGLALASIVANAHRGTLGAERKTNPSGTLVRFWLPSSGAV
jgi:two-component system phosphate regulon sensor histidine kinase PhoR